MDKIKYFHKNEIEKDLKFMDDDFHNKVNSKITKQQNDYRGRRYKEEFFFYFKNFYKYNFSRNMPKFENFDNEINQNDFDQKEFSFCKKILKQKRWETPMIKKLNMKGMIQLNNEYLKNEQFQKAEVNLILIIILKRIKIIN